MRTEELDYHLPPELIATRPAEPRDSARMLVVQREDDRWTLSHRLVRDIPDYLRSSDLMVCNVSRVLPARLEGRRAKTGGRIEGLFLEEPAVGTWKVMLRSNGRLHVGDQIELGTGSARCTITLVERAGELWVVSTDPPRGAADLLAEVGLTPLPPYILKARGDAQIGDESDRQWYQTVYAATEHQGSVAAPTAGLHFTPDLLERVAAKGVTRAEVVLHVGPGTFKPVSTETLEEHPMHEESFTVPSSTVEALRAHRGNGRVIAIGTTTVRALESVAKQIESGAQGPISGTTRLLIAPPYQFHLVDAMLTNFHLPRSTLLALIAAMVGRDQWRAMYEEAVRQRYRFYSYGDAMLILP